MTTTTTTTRIRGGWGGQKLTLHIAFELIYVCHQGPDAVERGLPRLRDVFFLVLHLGAIIANEAVAGLRGAGGEGAREDGEDGEDVRAAGHFATKNSESVSSI